LEVLAVGTLNHRKGEYTDRLILTVRFKIPNKLLKVKRSIILCNWDWDGYSTYEQYLDDMIRWSSNKEMLTEEVEKLAKNYIKDIEYSHELKDKKSALDKRLKELGKIEVKVKID